MFTFRHFRARVTRCKDRGSTKPTSIDGKLHVFIFSFRHSIAADYWIRDPVSELSLAGIFFFSFSQVLPLCFLFVYLFLVTRFPYSRISPYFVFFCQRNFIPCNHAMPFSVFSIAVCHYGRSFMLYRYKSRYPRWYIKWRKERENRETIPNELAFINIRFPFNCPLSGNRDRSKWRLHGTFYNHDF